MVPRHSTSSILPNLHWFGIQFDTSFHDFHRFQQISTFLKKILTEVIFYQQASVSLKSILVLFTVKNNFIGTTFLNSRHYFICDISRDYVLLPLPPRTLSTACRAPSTRGQQKCKITVITTETNAIEKFSYVKSTTGKNLIKSEAFPLTVMPSSIMNWDEKE